MQITKLDIFDFDGTLFRSPEKPEGWSHGWWGRLESLTPPCVPENPPSSWWNSPVVSAARQSISDPDILSVLATGRLESRFKGRIRDLLQQAGLRFDAVFLSGSGGSLNEKLSFFENLLTRHTEVEAVEVWEDRAEHVGKFESFFESKGLLVTMNHIKIPDMECASRVARRYLDSSGKGRT